MTREEAIQVLQTALTAPFIYGEYANALDMAIEALSDDSISRKDTVTLNSPITIQAEMVPVVRCKDCIHYESDGGALMVCRIDDMVVDDTDYCSYGERREL